MIQKSFFRLTLPAVAGALFALPAAAKVPTVVTDIPAVGALVQQVMGDLGRPTVLMDQGGDPHHYQLRPSQAAGLQDADLLIWVGPELAPWLARSADSMAQGKSLPLLALPDTLRRSYEGAEDHGHEHAAHDHDHGGHDHEHGAGDGHDHSGTDPHAWLDPQNGQTWLLQIAQVLARKDAENAATYLANAEKAAAAIAALDTQIAAQLQPLKGQHFVVFHDAYGYFTDHYGLEPAIAVSLGDASTPSAARLRQIQDQIKDSGATCAFPEVNHDPKLLQVVIEGTGARQGQALDPEGSSHGQDGELYTAILQGIGGAITACMTAGN